MENYKQILVVKFSPKTSTKGVLNVQLPVRSWVIFSPTGNRTVQFVLGWFYVLQSSIYPSIALLSLRSLQKNPKQQTRFLINSASAPTPTILWFSLHSFLWKIYTVNGDTGVSNRTWAAAMPALYSQCVDNFIKKKRWVEGRGDLDNFSCHLIHHWKGHSL